MNLGSRLKQILDERGLTVTQFSKEANVPAQTLYALINRDSNKADMDILIKVLTTLNMDFFTFMGADAPSGASVANSASPLVIQTSVTSSVVEINLSSETSFSSQFPRRTINPTLEGVRFV